MTLEDYKKFVAIDDMSELADQMLLLGRTLAEGCLLYTSGFNNYRRIYNDIIEEKIIEGRQGIEQERYLTITIERKNFEEAKAQFATLEATNKFHICTLAVLAVSDVDFSTLNLICNACGFSVEV